MGRKSKFAPEVRERAVRLVQEQEVNYESQWAATCSSLRGWAVRQRRCESGRARQSAMLANVAA